MPPHAVLLFVLAACIVPGAPESAFAPDAQKVDVSYYGLPRSTAVNAANPSASDGPPAGADAALPVSYLRAAASSQHLKALADTMVPLKQSTPVPLKDEVPSLEEQEAVAAKLSSDIEKLLPPTTPPAAAIGAAATGAVQSDVLLAAASAEATGALEATGGAGGATPSPVDVEPADGAAVAPPADARFLRQTAGLVAQLGAGNGRQRAAGRGQRAQHAAADGSEQQADDSKPTTGQFPISATSIYGHRWKTYPGDPYPSTDHTTCDDILHTKGCKYTIAKNELKCCRICPDRLGFNEVGGYPFEGKYGWPEFLEKPPNEGFSQWQMRPRTKEAITEALKRASPEQPDLPDGLKPPSEDAEDSQTTALLRSLGIDPEQVVPPEDEALSPDKKPVPPTRELTAKEKWMQEKYDECSAKEDPFELPCCRICGGDYVPAKIVNFFAPPAPFDEEAKESTWKADKDECCASEASCCRWCPEFTCEALEHSGMVPELWWSLCRMWNQLDDINPIQHELVTQAIMKKRIEDDTFWDPSSDVVA